MLNIKLSSHLGAVHLEFGLIKILYHSILLHQTSLEVFERSKVILKTFIIYLNVDIASNGSLTDSPTLIMRHSLIIHKPYLYLLERS